MRITQTLYCLLPCLLIGAALSGGANAQTAAATGRGAPPKPALLAAAPAEAVTAKARELYAEGVKAFREQRWPEAYAAFMGAWALNKHYTIAGNLGAVELELGKARDAAEHLAAYMRELAKDEKSTKEEREAGARTYERARGRVVALTVSIDVAGADIRVDGHLVGTSPLIDPLFVEPGKHSVEARAADHMTARREVEGQAGESKEMAMVLAKLPAMPSASSAPTSRPLPPERSMIPVYVMGGVALVGAAVGAGLVAGSRQKYDSTRLIVDEIRAESRSCVGGAANYDERCAVVAANGREVNALRDAGIAGLATGGAAAAGALLYLLWPRPAPAKPGLALLPVASKEAAGLIMTGSY